MSAPRVLPGVSACAIWAFCNITNKLLIDHGVEPLTLLLGQLLVSTPCLWVIVLARCQRLPKTGKRRLLGLGIWQPAIAYGTSLVGLSMTSVTVEALIFSTETLMIIFFAWALLGERPGHHTLAAGILGSVGVALVAGIGSGTGGQSGSWGPALILIGTAAAALYSALLRREAERADAITLIALTQSGGLGATFLAWFAWPTADRLQNLTGQALLLTAVSGVLMHSVGFVLFAKQLQSMEASTASLLLLIIPVLTAVLGFAILSERLDAVQICGAIIVLAATLIEIVSGETSRRDQIRSR